MSSLRLFGIIVGVIGLLATFLVYRGPKWKRVNFTVFSIINICLIAISANPNFINFTRDILSLQQYQYGRLLALLIISSLFLLFYSFNTKSKLESLRIQMDKLVRNLGVTYFEERVKLKDNIKPIMVLLPAYNEAENLKELLTRLPGQICGIETGVLVVDDGSDDETFLVSSNAGVSVVKNPINRGGGAALRLGYDLLQKGGCQICVTMDADGQHQPEEIEKLVYPIKNDVYEFVIGSRILGQSEKGSLFRLTGVYLFGWIISLLLGKKITDPSSGFRAFKMETIGPVSLYEDQYHTSELIIKAAKNGKRIGEVPITILKRRHGKSKKGSDWKYGLNFAKAIVKAWWK